MPTPATPAALAALRRRVAREVQDCPIHDIHTHLYDPAFGDLLLWGIDDLLTYHYLISETFRYVDGPSADFWKLNKEVQAERVWDELFLKRSPLSEACQGVLTALNRLGIDPRRRDLPKIRRWFAAQKPAAHVDRVLDLAGVSTVCMTNSPFDDLERPVWEGGFQRHDRFKAALRIDPLLLDWKRSSARLRKWGYRAGAQLNAATISAVRRFLSDWSRRMNAGFLMVSLPPDFAYPATSDAAVLIERAVVPHCQETGQPFAVMPGVKRGVNPSLRLAGDGVGLSDLSFLQNLCSAHPDVKFAATVLARENQHELCVLGRKFRNLHLFGCWWFLNTPSLIGEMTRMRLELLGLSFTPQHSDARVLDQLLYKWPHSRQAISEVLEENYTRLATTGWQVADADIRHDVAALFGGEFHRFCTSNPQP